MLTITARFPAGQYLAHNGRGWPEWPPSPARLLTAILATAYRTGTGIKTARRLFELPPPVISTPPAGDRATDYSRWVPVDVTLDIDTGKIGRGGVTGNLAKPPERGTTVGDRPVEFRFENAALNVEELTTLDAIFTRVPYLGRPTSPVILNRLPEPSEDDADHTIWTPDPAGKHRIQVATPQLLQALDAREQEREAVGITGHHPRLTARPVAHYTRHLPGKTTRGSVTPATAATVNQIAQGLTYYATHGATPTDAIAVTDALRTPNSSALAVPVFGTLTSQGLEIPRLFGMAIAGPGPASIWCLVNGQPQELTARILRGNRTEQALIAQVWGTAMGWTTMVPVANQPADIRSQLCHIAAAHGATIADATLHTVARYPLAPDIGFNPQLTHISVLFDQAIEGPIDLAGVALTPFQL